MAQSSRYQVQPQLRMDCICVMHATCAGVGSTADALSLGSIGEIALAAGLGLIVQNTQDLFWVVENAHSVQGVTGSRHWAMAGA